MHPYSDGCAASLAHWSVWAGPDELRPVGGAGLGEDLLDQLLNLVGARKTAGTLGTVGRYSSIQNRAYTHASEEAHR